MSFTHTHKKTQNIFFLILFYVYLATKFNPVIFGNNEVIIIKIKKACVKFLKLLPL